MNVRRREFITLLGGAAVWPMTAGAQQPDLVRRIGFLWNLDPSDPVGKSWVAAFMRGLAELGWSDGRNLQVSARWNPRTPEQMRAFGDELIALHPDVLVTGTQRLTLTLQQQTKTIPIVFVGAGDPLVGGIVPSLSKPGGNTTGVTDLFPSVGGKWVELLKECVPSLTQVAVVFNPDTATPVPAGAASSATAAAIAEAGSRNGVTVIEMPVRNAGEIERAIPAFAAGPGRGLIVRPPPLPGPDRKLLNGLAVRYQLPVIYQDRSFAVDGGLLAYGTDMIYMFGHDAPPYVDRILRGAKPGDLPVQFPTKFILTVNLTTARVMGLKIPESFLARADELIE